MARSSRQTEKQGQRRGGRRADWIFPVTELVGTAFKTMMWVGCILLLGRWGFATVIQIVPELAGRNTVANFEFVMNWGFVGSLTWGGVMTGAWHVQRRRNGTLTRDLHAHIRALELQLNPDRQSSKLTKEGETNRRDR